MSRKRYTPETDYQHVARSRGGLWRRASPLVKLVARSAYRSRVTIAGARNMAAFVLTRPKRLKDLEKENGRLRKAISDLTLDKLILKEALEGNC